MSSYFCVVRKATAFRLVLASFIMFLSVAFTQAGFGQQTLGAVNGTVTDTSGAVVQGAEIRARNVATNLEVNAESKSDGSFSIADLPIGTYKVTLTKTGFESAVYPQIIVQGNRTTTMARNLSRGSLRDGYGGGTPLLNQTDTTNGYTLGSDVIQTVPLGTGSLHSLRFLHRA